MGEIAALAVRCSKERFNSWGDGRGEEMIKTKLGEKRSTKIWYCEGIGVKILVSSYISIHII